MIRTRDFSWIVSGMAVFAGAGAAAQTPTYSLNLMEINSVPVVGNGATRMAVAPGDVLTAVVYLRDWSPDGQMAAACQAELDHAGFKSGTRGSIKPVGYETTTLRGKPNKQNAFMDTGNPRFIHFGRETVSYADTDTVSPGYRWISVLFGDVGPVSRQDGTRFYVGSVKLYVSKDAEGTFQFNLVPGRNASGVLEFDGQPVSPVEVEPLILDVNPEGGRIWISGSRPQSGAVDARSPSGGASSPWQRIELTLSRDAAGVSASDFAVEDGTQKPPEIRRVDIGGRKVAVQLNRPISVNTWTTITHVPSSTGIRIGRLHGDVDGNGLQAPGDLRYLIGRLNEGGTGTTYSSDVDGSGRVDAADVLELLSLVVSAGSRRLTSIALP